MASGRKAHFELRSLIDEVDALCRARVLGRNLTLCAELLSAAIAMNEARERLEAMMLADGWKKIESPPVDDEAMGAWFH